MNILNLTQHIETNAQIASGVFRLKNNSKVIKLLNFTDVSSKEDILSRAKSLAAIAKKSGATHAMIGGASYLMGPLEVALRKVGIVPLYSFTPRVSNEIKLEEGCSKTSIFTHCYFVEGAM